jgi:hypothetical protein
LRHLASKFKSEYLFIEAREATTSMDDMAADAFTLPDRA